MPGDTKRLAKAEIEARRLLALAEGVKSMEELAVLELTYNEICALLESGTVVPGSKLQIKLRAARDVFLRQPKQYGSGLKMAPKKGNK